MFFPWTIITKISRKKIYLILGKKEELGLTIMGSDEVTKNY